MDISPAHNGELKNEIEFYCLDNQMKIFEKAKPMVLKDQYGNDVNVEQRDDRIWYAVFQVEEIGKKRPTPFRTPIIVCNKCEAGSCIGIDKVNSHYSEKCFTYTSKSVIIEDFKSLINSEVQPVFPSEVEQYSSYYYRGPRCFQCPS